MYRNSYQRGMLTVFFSVGSKPLAIWDIHTQEGYLSRFLDQDIKSMVLDIRGSNVSTTYITCPKGNMVLGITMPFLVMVVKNLKKYFSFEVTILDETHTRRRFRVSNFQSSTQILPLCTVMPIGLSDGWNQIQFNLAEFTRRAYNKQYLETQKLKINANIRLRRIYFCERLHSDDQLPPEYKLYFPLSSKPTKGKKTISTKDKNTIHNNSNQENVEPTSENHRNSKTAAETKAPEKVSSQYNVQNKSNFVAKTEEEKGPGSVRHSIVPPTIIPNTSITDSSSVLKENVSPATGSNQNTKTAAETNAPEQASSQYGVQNESNFVAEAEEDKGRITQEHTTTPSRSTTTAPNSTITDKSSVLAAEDTDQDDKNVQVAKDESVLY